MLCQLDYAVRSVRVRDVSKLSVVHHIFFSLPGVDITLRQNKNHDYIIDYVVDITLRQNKNHDYIIDYVVIEEIRLSFEISHTRTDLNRNWRGIDSIGGQVCVSACPI